MFAKLGLMDENITFEERWQRLLDETKEGLRDLNKANREEQIRCLWKNINRYVTIMAVPKEILPKARKTLLKMAWKAPLALMFPVGLYALMTFLPRNWYRNTNTQQWFKRRIEKQ